MTIIEKSQGLNERQVFTITHGSGLVNVKDCDGRTFDVVDYILYADADRRSGEERELLALVTNDGDILCTNSATVISTFKDIRDQFALPVENVQIVSGQSKNGRTYYDLVLA